MIRRLSRRLSLKLLSSLAVFGFPLRREAVAQASDADRLERWDCTENRVFLGGECWANPMEDWRIRDGWAECLVSSGKRSVHSLTRALRHPEGSFTMSVRFFKPEGLSQDGGAGFRIGVRSDIDEYRSKIGRAHV